MEQIITAPSLAEGATKRETRQEQVLFEYRRWPYVAMTPAYGALVVAERLFPPQMQKLLDRLCPTHGLLRRGGGTWRALQALYENHAAQNGSGRFNRFWCNLRNAQAVRNRLRIVKRELPAVIRGLGKTEVRILEVAAGSAIGLLETMATLQAEGITVCALLLDLDPTALEYSSALAERMGLGNQVQTICDNAARVLRVASTFKPDVIEMVGFLDYFSDERARKLFRHIWTSLPEYGRFVTANIMPNSEAFVVHGLFRWPAMVYRTPAALRSLLDEAKFIHIQTYTEPLGIHTLAVAEKGGS